MSRHIRLPRLSFLMLLAFLPLLDAAAQSTPAPGSPMEMQMAVTVDAVPKDAEVWFLRFFLEPGAQLPAGPLPGSTLVLVESGEVTLSSDQPMMLKRASATMPGTPISAPAGDTTLRAGEGALITEGAETGAHNAGAEQARLLVLLISSPEREVSGGSSATPAAQATGVRVQLVSVGRVTFPEGSGVILVERDLVKPYGSTVSSTHNGIELGAIEQGRAHVNVLMGENRVRPGILNATATTGNREPVPFEMGSTQELTAGDGYTSLDGSLTWRSTSEEPLIVLRAVVFVIPGAP